MQTAAAAAATAAVVVVVDVEGTAVDKAEIEINKTKKQTKKI